MLIRNVGPALLGVAISLSASAQGVSVLGQGGTALQKLKLSVVVDQSANLVSPSDLAFNPINPNELYVTNFDATSAVLLTFDNAKAPRPIVKANKLKIAPGSQHFMPYPSALAFADNGFFATIHDIEVPTLPTTPGDFMGPTLWTVTAFDGGHPSHMDMLHNSPSGLGIAWIHGNAYVVNDGYHGSLTVYDFRRDHGPGMHDHSDGVALRYADGLLKRSEKLPAHVVFDKASGVAYAVDSGHNRIVSIDLGLAYKTTADGFDSISLANQDYKATRAIQPNYDGSVQRYVDGAELMTLVEGSSVGMETPTGLALHDGILYVSDHAQNTLYAFDRAGKLVDKLKLGDVLNVAANAGLAGLEFDAVGRLYVTDLSQNRILRLEVMP